MTKLLVVDDNEQNRYMLQVLLKGHGYEVVLAADGVEALETARHDPPDMIISDILMPAMDGFALCRHWKGDKQLQHIPFVFYTATYTDPKDEEFALSLGAERFIIKPMEPEAFIKVLQEVIQTHQAGQLIAPRQPIEEQEIFFKEYNETLVRKLEEHVVKLEGEIAERKRAEEALRQRNRELALLNRASRVLSSTLDLDQVFTIILEEVRHLMDAAICSIWLIAPETGDLICRQATGPKSQVLYDWRLRPEQGLAGWVVRTGESLVVPDVRLDARHYRGVDPHDELGVRSVLSVPLQVVARQGKRDVIGVLQVLDTEVDRFDTSDLELLEPLATSAAIAIENARLYNQAQQEITERQHAETERNRLLAQIQEQAGQLQQIMQAVPEGVLLLDMNGRVVLANPVAEKYLDTLAGAKIGDTITRVGNRLLAELLTSPPKGLWHDVESDSLSSQYFEVIARPIETGPISRGWVMVVRDVTQQREAERYVRQQDKLAAVGQLAAGIAHDFNNIMATVVLYAQMSARDEGLPAKVRERMKTVNQQAQHATKLIRQILDFSRRTVLERRPLDLLPLLKEQVQLLERILPENIQVKLDYGRDEYTVRADLTGMQQMIMNLAVNARDAMPEGGELCLELRRMRVESRHEAPLPEMDTGEWVYVIVSDTGSGISADSLPYIFDPFFTTKALGEGTGLGLAQVHGIVGSHEGAIDVESHVGEGTTFTIYLPALPVHPLDPTISVLEEAQALPKGDGETILVVEDDVAVRGALVESLKLLDYRVREAANGHEALQVLDKCSTEISLILSDVVMPGMGGKALLYTLRERGLTVPVVMLTGHSVQGEMEELRTQGVADWLPKPPRLEQLSKVITRMLKAAGND